MSLLLQLLAIAVVNAALYTLLAIGFGLAWRTLKIFHVAYGGLFVVSAYCFYELRTAVGMSPVAAFLATLACSAAAGWLAEVLIYRPFKRKEALSSTVLIASFGVYLVIENAVAIAFGNELRTIPRSMPSILTIGSIALTEVQCIQLVVSVAVVTAISVARRSLVFKRLWALGDQPDLVPVLGLPADSLRSLALIASTTIAGVAAALICFDVGIQPHAGLSYLLTAVVAVLVGGVDSYAGWIRGAVLVAFLQSVGVWLFSSRWTDLITFCTLIAMLLARPERFVTRRVEQAT